ncbi:MAG TPA: hypothetical protein IAD47_00110 [Candidatus Limihabitans stercoravium]|nr:hypothetical protein [Candidatus Limihabitans stercoravium]
MQLLYSGSYSIYGELRRKSVAYGRQYFCFAFKIDGSRDTEGYGLIECVNTIAFILKLDEVKEIIQELQHLYDNLSGQCTIQESEDVDFMELYFDGRFLKLKGKISGFHDMYLFGENPDWNDFDRGIDVDQTILLPLINLFKSAINN